jgi:hypothetical protein
MKNAFTDKAMNLARAAHHGQTYDGASYFEGHLKKVAAIAEIFTDDPELIAGCFLHDTVEDTHITLDKIRLEFGDRVAAMVDAVTDGEGATRAEKKVESYRKLAISSDGRFVKICDRISHLEAALQNLKFAETYINESEEFVKKIFVLGEHTELWIHYFIAFRELFTVMKHHKGNRHNHITRDIKPQGECPACDEYHAKSIARNVLADSLYELNVGRETLDGEVDRVLKAFSSAGIDVTLKKKVA